MLRGGSVLRRQGLRAEGKGWRTIARETGHSKNTVKKYLRDGHPVGRRPRRKRPTKLAPFIPYMEQWMQDGLFNCAAIPQRLKARGYTGGVTPIKDFGRPHRPPRVVTAKRRDETPPGEQAPIDWGSCEAGDAAGHAHQWPAFVMVLGYSRAMSVEFTRRCDIDSFLRCFLHALEYFGGVPPLVLTDHMKTVVLGRHEDGSPQWHPLFADCVLAVGLTPKLCRVRVPQTKGKVERSIQFVKNHCWPGRHFTRLEDLHRQARAWCAEQDERIHGTTGERPVDRRAVASLRPLPPPDRLQKFLRKERKVSLDGFVSGDGGRYGVPWPSRGRLVWVRQIGDTVEIWSDQECLARHRRAEPWHGQVPLPDQ